VRFDLVVLDGHEFSHAGHVDFERDQVEFVDVFDFGVDGGQVFDYHQACFIDFVDLAHASHDLGLFVDRFPVLLGSFVDDFAQVFQELGHYGFFLE
jgi:hypothetical protein